MTSSDSTCYVNEWASMGSGCGSVVRAVASDTRGMQFESSHRQSFLVNVFIVNCWKDENKENEAGNYPLLIKWRRPSNDTVLRHF